MISQYKWPILMHKVGVCRLNFIQLRKATRGRISKNRDLLMTEFRYKNPNR